jgi:putative ABC transport system permease protein
MDFDTGIRVALRALARHKLRNGLAMLGIIVGVGTFICSVAVGQGASIRIEEQIYNLGENMIWIEAGGRNVNGVRTGTHGTDSLTLEDARAIQDQISLVHNVSPHVNTRVQVVHRNKNWGTMVRGVSPEYLAIRRWSLGSGSSFSQDDVAFARKVCVLGQTVVANLFGGEDPVGQTISVDNIPCRVIGVLKRKGQSAVGRDQDDVLLMPYTTVQKKIKGISWLDDIMCSAVSPAAIATAEEEITALLRQRHHILVGQEDDFNLRHPADVAQVKAEAQDTMTLLLASIATVALLVAGVGIMNIMLASVTERTREIGIRMAVGARDRDILFQFLTEALVLSLIGGMIGIVLGVGASHLISQIFRWPTLISPQELLLSFSFAGVVGIFFGFYPARRASRLDPIEALRR